MQFLLDIIIELVALIIAIIHYPYLKESYMKWTLPFLLIVFVGEVFSYLQHLLFNQSTTIVQYIIGIAESIFYGYIFYCLSVKNEYKNGIIYFTAISISIYLIGLIFYPYSYSFFIPSLIFTGFFFALFALIFIYTKFIEDENTILINEPGFWIAFGVSLFFAGSCIVFSLYNFILKNNLNVFGVRLYNFIPSVLCIVLYSSISYAIILCKKKTKV